MFELADEKIGKVAEVEQTYLTDALVFVTYLIDKGEAQDAEDEFVRNIEKAKKRF